MDPIPDRISRFEKVLDAWDKRKFHKIAWYQKMLLEEPRAYSFDKFDMFVDRYCLLGRLFGSYLAGLEYFHLKADSAVYHGLASARPSEYKLLTAAWRERILARLAERSPPLSSIRSSG